MRFRIASRILTLLAVGLVASALGSAAATPGKDTSSTKPGGKKPIGTVAAFDAATGVLTVTTNDGGERTGTLAPDVQIKVEHRGKYATGKGHGNPTAGSTDDIVAGARVLRMKEDEGVVTHLRLRPVPADLGPGTTDDQLDDPKDDTFDDGDDDDKGASAP
jgi:hypothetical protein